MNNHTRGGGWWRWKPYYLLRELRAVRQGDVMVRCAAASLRRSAVTRSPARPGPSAPSVGAHRRRPSALLIMALLTVALLTMTGAHGLRPAAHVAPSGALVPRAERSARRRHFPLPVPHRQVEPCLSPTPHPGLIHASPGPHPRSTASPAGHGPKPRSPPRSVAQQPCSTRPRSTPAS